MTADTLAAAAPRDLPVSTAKFVDALRMEAAAIVRAGSFARFARAALDFDDLVQAGALGYLKALDRVTAETRHPHAFAMASAKGAMLDALRNGEPPPDVRFAGLDTPGARSARAAARSSVLDGKAAGGGAFPRDPRFRRRARVGLAALPRAVRRAIGRLTPKQREAIRLLLGDLTPTEIAERYGTTSNAASLRRHQAIAALRSRLIPQPKVSASGGRSPSRRSSCSTNPPRSRSYEAFPPGETRLA